MARHRGRKHCGKLIRVWLLTKKGYRRLWRWLRNGRGMSDALERIARLTGFIVMVGLLMWVFCHELEELCRLMLK